MQDLNAVIDLPLQALTAFLNLPCCVFCLAVAIIITLFNII
jgi:hypothetical protein